MLKPGVLSNVLPRLYMSPDYSEDSLGWALGSASKPNLSQEPGLLDMCEEAGGTLPIGP